MPVGDSNVERAAREGRAESGDPTDPNTDAGFEAHLAARVGKTGVASDIPAPSGPMIRAHTPAGSTIP
jgi:hypothetical protein